MSLSVKSRSRDASAARFLMHSFAFKTRTVAKSRPATMTGMRVFAAAAVIAAAAAAAAGEIADPANHKCCAMHEGNFDSPFTVYGLNKLRRADEGEDAVYDSGHYYGRLAINVQNKLYLRLLDKCPCLARCHKRAAMGAFLFIDPRSSNVTYVGWDSGIYDKGKKQCWTYSFKPRAYMDWPRMCIGEGSGFPRYKEMQHLDWLTKLFRYEAPCGKAILTVHPITCAPWSLTLNMSGVKPRAAAPADTVWAEYPQEGENGLPRYARGPEALPPHIHCGNYECHRFRGRPALIFANASRSVPSSEDFGVPDWCEHGAAAWRRAQVAMGINLNAKPALRQQKAEEGDADVGCSCA